MTNSQPWCKAPCSPHTCWMPFVLLCTLCSAYCNNYLVIIWEQNQPPSWNLIDPIFTFADVSFFTASSCLVMLPCVCVLPGGCVDSNCKSVFFCLLAGLTQLHPWISCGPVFTFLGSGREGTRELLRYWFSSSKIAIWMDWEAMFSQCLIFLWPRGGWSDSGAVCQVCCLYLSWLLSCSAVTYYSGNLESKKLIGAHKVCPFGISPAAIATISGKDTRLEWQAS